MPIDQKRINGPEISVPYEIYIPSEAKQSGVQSNIPKRHGRSHDELRNICKIIIEVMLCSIDEQNLIVLKICKEILLIVLKAGIISQAKGSAYIEMGDTKVICSVFDPREVHNKTGYCIKGELFCEFKFAPFSHRKRKLHQQDAEEKEYSLILQRALEPAVCLVCSFLFLFLK